MNGDTSQLIALMRLGERRVRSLTTRFDTSGGVTLITVADVRPARSQQPAWAHEYAVMGFRAARCDLVLVWVGIQLGLRPVNRLRDEIAARSPRICGPSMNLPYRARLHPSW